GEVEAEVAEVLAEGRGLGVDPGHFSFDWVLIQQGELQKRSCGSSVEAMAALLEGAAAKIGEDFGGRVEADRIEQALQEGKEHILLFGRKVEIAPYVEQAVREVVPVAVERLRVAMRRQEGDLDALVLVGGGAAWWEGGIRELFPKVPVIRPVDPILANARGFFELGAGSG
ncbi:MAG: plasmid stability protein StbA, partial [Methylohalobius sp.]|nr:plasmid stability protein StbA [Methylohalobius sp.]